uniref:Minor histocompatibility antigen H13 n=1 Tax=Castor canadensis TaxID=51338 RepID=A0A8C0ZU65_CASCN
MDSAVSDPHNGSTEAGGPANVTTRPPSTPEGIALAYGSLLLMALLPIFFGSLRSVRCARGKNASDMPETITSRDAARFPIIASCTLLGLYLFFKIFSQEYINLLLSMYFFVLGILALSHTISLKKNTHTYFYTSFAAYIFGLGLTISIMHIFKHAQPALLYLVPACIGFPILVALAKGEVTEMFSYEESNPKDPTAVTESKDATEASASKKQEKKEK